MKCLYQVVKVPISFDDGIVTVEGSPETIDLLDSEREALGMVTVTLHYYVMVNVVWTDVADWRGLYEDQGIDPFLNRTFFYARYPEAMRQQELAEFIILMTRKKVIDQMGYLCDKAFYLYRMVADYVYYSMQNGVKFICSDVEVTLSKWNLSFVYQGDLYEIDLTLFSESLLFLLFSDLVCGSFDFERCIMNSQDLLED